jgi:hypothetical protein
MPFQHGRWPAAAGALPRSRGAHHLPAALRAAGGGADHGLESADRAWASGRGAGGLRLRASAVLAYRGWHRRGLGTARLARSRKPQIAMKLLISSGAACR